ncbi:MAG TPA: DUF5995 family protein [Candidatus Dormibacteraeota bacterium]|nr:DUF5995 family protein [Candidatus Dormibacteraeota bacterium]
MTKTGHGYTYHISTKRINTPKAVIAELEKLNPLLTGSELLPVSFFNRAYIIVTKKINQANDEGLFQHSKLMNELEVAFAKRYFDALNHYAVKGFLPDGWNKVNRGWLHYRHPASLSLMLGANAHINHDLLRSLEEVVRTPEKFSEDYFKVNQLLLESARAISSSYYESQEHINFLKKNLRSVYLGPVMRLILRWRTRVWRELLETAS